MSESVQIVDVGVDFTRYPVGRTLTDGPFSGEAFRNRFLIAPLDENRPIIIKLDSALAYGSSFLEEAFGGLVRLNYPKSDIFRLINLDTTDTSLREEIASYINKALPPEL